MSGRRRDDPVTPLCRFAFKNGRRCASPAHPDFDGLCYNHGTLAARASRQDNLQHQLAPLASGRSSVKARQRGLRALSRAIDAGRLSPEQVRALNRISVLIENSGRFADEQSFAQQSGPAWDRLRRLIDGEE